MMLWVIWCSNAVALQYLSVHCDATMPWFYGAVILWCYGPVSSVGRSVNRLFNGLMVPRVSSIL